MHRRPQTLYTSQCIRFTDALQKAFVIGGATTAESTAASIQITQALGSGRLAGDAPGLALCLVDVLFAPRPVLAGEVAGGPFVAFALSLDPSLQLW